MGIYDRGYMRRSYRRGGSGMTVTQLLIAANVAAFILGNLLLRAMGHNPLDALMMRPADVLHGQVWQLWTSTFLHADFWHIAVNMLVLLIFGPHVERAWGARKFFWVYTFCGVIGGVLFVLLSLMGFVNPLSPCLGASGCILGVVGAAAVLFPDAEVWLFFAIPMSLRTASFLFAGFYMWNIVFQGQNYGGDIFHLTGMAAGAGIALLE